MRHALCRLLALIVLGGAVAAEASSMRLVGEARLQVLFWPIYESRLYSQDGEYDDDALPLRLEIEYLRDIPAERLVERTRIEWQQLGLEHPRHDQWLGYLEQIWPDIEKTDVLELEVDGEGASTFFHNGRRLGRIEDPAFGRQFLDIWLSPRTSRPDLRAQLLGRAD